MGLSPEFIALQEALLGRYSLERELGRGGMGAVFLARDVRLDRPVAIKFLRADLAADPEARSRFLHEARTAARLAHPHIIPIYAVESDGPRPYLVMALVDGETLGARLRRRGALPPDEGERLLRELAWALGYAHAQGVVHRDITLENVLIERETGRVLLGDFGLATAGQAIEAQPRFGTPGYLAPEVIRGEPATPASDIYALGVVSWHALAGRAPFEADTPAALLAKHLVHPLPSLAPLARGVSRRLVAAVEQCLAKDADARPAGAAALLALLERAPEPVALAPALRHWFTRWERFRPIYSLATPILAVQTWLLVWGSRQFESQAMLVAAAISSVLTITAIPLLGHLGFEAWALRALHRAGFGIADIRAAYPLWRDTLERDRRKEGLPPLPGRVVFDLTVVGAVVLAVVFIFIYPNVDQWYPWRPEAAYVQRTILAMSSTLYLATLTGIGIGFASPGFRIAPGGRFRRLVERFWQSRLAAAITALASLGQRRSLPASSTLHRNTELVLGLAVDDLWHAIPATLREGLGDVPALAHTLQASAVELRDIADRLRESERDTSHDEGEQQRVIETREAVEQRHREAVTTLERLRLQLLRLVALKEQSVELTTHLAEARELEQSLLVDLSAHNDVRVLLGRRARRVESSPTPTPKAA
jgi:serine/threonine-protein kinase